MAQFASPTALLGQTILVAEDEPLIAFDVEQSLRRSGADAAIAATLSEALLAAERPDLTCAVLDIKLGQQIIDPVCIRLTARGIPFLFTSGLPSPDDETWKHIPVLAKPVDAMALISAVVSLLADRSVGPIRQTQPGDGPHSRR